MVLDPRLKRVFASVFGIDPDGLADVIQTEHPVTLGGKPVTYMGAEEACTPGNECCWRF